MGNGTSEPGVLGVQNTSFLDNIDMSTVIHAAVIVIVALVVYHLLFHR